MCKYTYIHIHEVICLLFASNEKIWSDTYQTSYKKNNVEGPQGTDADFSLYSMYFKLLELFTIKHIYISLRYKNITK